MTIKTFAFFAQQTLAERFGPSIKRSHVYESLAAALGFASYAALCADSVIDAAPQKKEGATWMLDRVSQRLSQLGVDQSTSP